MDSGGETFPELETLDNLIAGLEALITESDESPLRIDSSDTPKRGVYRLIGDKALGEKKRSPCEAVRLDEAKLVLRCNNTEAVRLSQVEAVVQAEKSGRGEVVVLLRGKVSGKRRVPGGYEIDVDITGMQKTRLTPGAKLLECLRKSDPAGWRRWRQDIHGIIDLSDMDLKKTELAGYDLCCSDLSGTDLTGANLAGAILAGSDLSRTKLDQAAVHGADFFRVRMKRTQAPFLTQSGMIEVESVLFED